MKPHLHTVKTGVKNSRLFSPKLYREYCYIRSNVKYAKRLIIGRDEWENVLDEPPVLAGFNAATICNAKCCYCASRFNEHGGIMGMRIYEKGVSEFSEMGGGTIGFSPLTGEPLLDPLLSERIEFASRFDNITDVLFDTNGIMLKDEKTRQNLIRHGSEIHIHMNISIPGFGREMFERVCNVPWDESILYGIRDLLKANLELGDPLDINFFLQPDGGGVLREHNFRTFILPYTTPEHIMLYGRLRDNWCGQIEQHDLTGDMELRRRLKFRNIPCEFLLDGHVDILVNGDVRMCGCRYGRGGGHDELVIGNIMERKLSEIWFGAKPRELCERFIASDVPTPCRECSLYFPY